MAEEPPGGGAAGDGGAAGLSDDRETPPPVTRVHDVIIVGLGITGRAAAYHLARRGATVLALDRHGPDHRYGSSHGESRMLRHVYYEDPLYVPIVRRACELWRSLEEAAGRTLLDQRGGLMLGEAGGTLMAGARRTARIHDLPAEVLSAREVGARFPPFEPPERLTGVWDPGAGYLEAAGCMEVLAREAVRAGADLRYGEPVRSWEAEGAGARVATPRSTYGAGHLVLAAGGWTGGLVPDLGLPLRVERQVLFWLAPREDPEAFVPDRFPVFLAEFEPGRFFYGFPRLDGGLKLSIYHGGQTRADPEAIRRDVEAGEEEELRRALFEVLPSANGPLLDARVCTFTNTPDEDFLLDRHPDHPRVLVCSPCSGHGFKFAPAIGEVLADLVVGNAPRFDLTPFRIGRLLT